jgi:hypothetical protein
MRNYAEWNPPPSIWGHERPETLGRRRFIRDDGMHYRWKYGSYLTAGFKMLQTHDYVSRHHRAKAWPFQRNWLERVELSATGSSSDFRLTGPFSRFCLCHSRFLDGLICVISGKDVKRWAVADAKSRVLCEATLDNGAVWFPDEVMYLWAP